MADTDNTVVRVTLKDVYDEVKALRTDMQTQREIHMNVPDDLQDHETRLRTLEKVAWSALGTGSIGVIGLIVKLAVEGG